MIDTQQAMSCSEETVIIRFGLSNNLLVPTHFFAKNCLFSHTIIFLEETNEKYCFEKVTKSFRKHQQENTLLNEDIELQPETFSIF